MAASNIRRKLAEIKRSSNRIISMCSLASLVVSIKRRCLRHILSAAIRVDNLRLTDSNDVTGFQGMLFDANVVDLCSIRALEVKQRICAES